MQSSSRFGMIVPLSAFCTARMSVISTVLSSSCTRQWISHFGFRPSKLFNGVNLRLSIALAQGKKNIESEGAHTSQFAKWNAEARDVLFSCMNYIIHSENEQKKAVIPKISTHTERQIIRKITSCARLLSSISASSSNYKVFYKKTGINCWITVTDFAPKAFRNGQLSQSSRQAAFNIGSKQSKDFSVCVLNSNLFFWFYTVFSNCRDLNPSDVNSFPIPVGIENDTAFSELSTRLMSSLDGNSEYITRNQKQTGTIRLQSFRSSLSKSIIDEVDVVLAKHYRLTDEELDFIINYDIKYRTGVQDLAND